MALMKIILAILLSLLVTVRNASGQVVTATIRSEVPRPSGDFTTYSEGELVRISVPSNWRELPGADAVTFAPDGAYGNAGVKSVFTHGIAMGVARNDRHSLRATTDHFIDAYVLVNPIRSRTFSYRPITLSGRHGLATTVSGMSEATGEIERMDVLTTLLADGTFFYVLAVTPPACALDYADTFRRIVASIEIRDRHVGVNARR
jgi:hypothetical protein